MTFNVLVVDDEEDLRDILKDMLGRAGCKVNLAKSGRDALKLMAEGISPDVILTDIRMPDGSGIELMDEVKRLYGDRKPTILCMSAFSDLSLENAFHKGADALFPKPLDFDAVLAAIRHFDSQRKQRLRALDEIAKRKAA